MSASFLRLLLRAARYVLVVGGGVNVALAVGDRRATQRPHCDCATSVHETTRRTMRAVTSALARYQSHYDEPCPPTLWSLVSTGFLPAFPRDGWGQTFVYQCPSSRGGDHADLISLGPDGHADTADDIHSWELR